ncbi:unnamed protein product [Polarella glacialis]|uniref:Serine aminopeptidase S33 domain-containing protein n=3 Tax=Polarella glacialis TaxID=89957 RepID=A0A813HPI4_POLGL|nr:unnamed protein product [Polarella glacialis]
MLRGVSSLASDVAAGLQRTWLGRLPPHSPVKYGDMLPIVPPSDAVGTGSFHRSCDAKLWLFTRAWEPPDRSKAWATLMIVHGTVDHSGVYAELGERLAAQGVAVFASDLRGWGRSDGEPMYFNDIEVFTDDVLADYERIHGHGSAYAHVGSRFLLGKSIGGLITAWAARHHMDKWNGLIGLSGAYQLPPANQPQMPLALVLHAAALLLPKYPCVQPFDPKLIVSDAAALHAWEQDPLASHGKVTPGYLFELLRTQARLVKELQGLDLPVLMLWGTSDQVVTKEGHRMLVDASRNDLSELMSYPGGFHNLLAEPDLKDDVISDIGDWMVKVCRQGKEKSTQL